MAGDEKKTKVVIDGDSRGGELAFTNMTTAAKKVQGEVSNLNSTLDTLRGLFAAGGIVAAVNASINAANQMERSNIALAVTARYVGEDMREVTSAAKELTKDGLMSVTEASQALQNLLSRGYNLQESVDLMNRLKDSASFNRQAHLEFGQAIVGATEGLKNENSVLVDNAGVTKNVSVMWKEYAAQLGKSVDNLSQAEKRQAEYNGIMKETEGQVGNAVRMADTFSGAQARINQQWFEAKAAFGSGLQPVLKSTLDLMTPIVKGLRDMVYWVETLGPRAAATVDKIKIAKDLALSGVGIFSSKGLAEYDRRTAPINAALDETIAEIVRRADGGTLPDIGADPGKRRSDSNIPDKKGSLSEGQRIALQHAKDQVRLFFQNVDEEVKAEIASEDWTWNKFSIVAQLAAPKKASKVSLGDFSLSAGTGSEMTDAQKEEFAQETEFMLRRIQLTRDYENSSRSAASGILEARLLALGQEEDALNLHYANKRQQLDSEYQMRIGYANQIGLDTSLIQQEYTLQQIQMEEEKAQRLADIWWNSAQTYIGFAEQMTTMGLQYLFFEEEQKGQIGRRMLATSIRFIAQGLQQYMFGKAKENVLNAAAAAGRISTDMMAGNANLGILQAQSTAWAAFFAAMSLNPYGGQAFIPAATAMTAVAGGVVPTALAAVNAVGATSIAGSLGTAAAWTAGGIAVGALGEAGATAIEGGTAGSRTPAGYGGGSYGSPVITQPTSAPQQAATVIIQMNGPIYGDRHKMLQWAEDELAPVLRDLTSRNVSFTVN